MSSCRYERGPCTFPTLRRHFRCQDGSCPEQAGRLCSRIEESPTGQTDSTQPAAAPSARKEAKTMTQGVKGTTRACDRCGKEAKLGTSKHASGKRLCVSCSARAFKRSKQGLELDEAGGSRKAATRPQKAVRASAKPAAPQQPRPAPTGQQRPDERASMPVIVVDTTRCAYLAAIAFLEARMDLDGAALGVLRELSGVAVEG